MAIFYKGAGIGTHWHTQDARQVGFTARSPATHLGREVLIDHIATSPVNSPYISLTRSYAVAWNYAVRGSTDIRTLDKPGYVYEIEFDTPLPSGLKLLDPIKEVAMSLPGPIDVDSGEGYPFYQHNGLPHFLLGVVGLGDVSHFQVGRQPQPPGPGAPCPPNLTPQLEALVNALRDAEILLHGHISPSYAPTFFGQIRYALNNVEQVESLPMDLGKGIFIATLRDDQLGNIPREKLEKILQKAAGKIIEIVRQAPSMRNLMPDYDYMGNDEDCSVEKLDEISGRILSDILKDYPYLKYDEDRSKPPDLLRCRVVKPKNSRQVEDIFQIAQKLRVETGENYRVGSYGGSSNTGDNLDEVWSIFSLRKFDFQKTKSK